MQAKSKWVVALCIFMATAACSDKTLEGGSGSVRTGGEGTLPAASPRAPGGQPVSEGQPGFDVEVGGADAATTGPGTSPRGGQAEPTQPRGGGRADSSNARPAATSGSTIGVTNDTISITVSGLFSGPYGAIVDKMYESGFQTWVRETNDRGGIHGRNVVAKKVDNQGTAEGAIAACKEESTNATLMTFILVGSNAEADCLDQAGIPAILQGSETAAPSWSRVRAVHSAAGVGGTLANFTKWELGASTKKIGVLVVEQPQFVGTAKQFIATARHLGLNVVVHQRAAQNQASFVSELSRMRDAGVEVAVLIVGTEVLSILRDAKAIGYQPTFTGYWWTIDELSQAAGDLMNGIKSLSAQARSDSQAFKDFRGEAARQGKRQASTTDLWAYGLGRLLGDVLHRAGPALTRESFVAAMDATRGYDSGVTPPVSWRSPDRIGFRAYFPIICCNPDRTWAGLGPPREDFAP